MEIKEEASGDTALMDALKRVCERGQLRFTNLLSIEHYDPSPSDLIPGINPFFYIAEIRDTYWLGFIHRERYYRKLFAIFPGLSGGAYGKKEVICSIFNPSLLEIVKEEIQKYADIIQASAVILNQKFS